MHGWVCPACNSLWDIGGAFIRYVAKVAKKEKEWLCCKCPGVLDPSKKVRSANGLEFGVVCPECGQWNPQFSFTSDPDCIPPDDISLVAGGVPDKKRDPDTDPDWTGSCSNCGESPIVPATGMCGPCTFGEASTAGGNW